MKRTTRLSSILMTTVLLPVTLFSLAGCGGGGGGGGGGGPTTANLIGLLKDTNTGTAIGGRTMTLASDSTIHAVTDGTGSFQLNGVPSSGIITVNIAESNGFVDGHVNIDVGSLSGSPKNAGTINFDLSSNPPPPPL